MDASLLSAPVALSPPKMAIDSPPESDASHPNSRIATPLVTFAADEHRPGSRKSSPAAQAMAHMAASCQKIKVLGKDGQPRLYEYNPKESINEAGEFGTVYLGVNPLNPTDRIAIKCFHDDEKKREERLLQDGVYGHRAGDEEACLKLAGLYRGKSVDSDGRELIIMDWVDGISPRDVVDAGYITTLKQLERLALDTVDAVRKLHTLGVVCSFVIVLTVVRYMAMSIGEISVYKFKNAKN